MKKGNQQRWCAIILVAFFLFGLTASDLFAQQAAPRDLQTALDDLEVGSDWIYGNLDEGITRAKQTGKPLFVLFR
jgi:hypothetical protein